MKDLKTYKDGVKILSSRSNSFMGYYPRKINEFFEIFTTADGLPKKEKFQTLVKNFFVKTIDFKYTYDIIKIPEGYDSYNIKPTKIYLGNLIQCKLVV